MINLLFTSIKPVSEPRINCIELQCTQPSRRLILQAESSQERDEWIQAIQSTTAELLNTTTPSIQKSLSPAAAGAWPPYLDWARVTILSRCGSNTDPSSLSGRSLCVQAGQ